MSIYDFKNFMAHKKIWHAMTNIGAINSNTQKFMCHKESWIAMKICDSLLPNGMACHHHMENLRVVINRKGQQFF
jgi:hypothetical protein